MNIALLGYGQMGKEIEQIALSRGHRVALIIDKDNLHDLNASNLTNIDVAIEFSRPESAVANFKICFESNVPVVAGTTGWLDKLPEVISLCDQHQTGFFYASNFSLGVNIFFALNRKLAALMAPFNQYQVRMNEIHHTRKLDAPSGTAITLAEGILAETQRFDRWVNILEAEPNELPITSERIGDVPGTHEIFYESPIDTITIRHEAHNRKGFATGAVLAAEFMKGKKGYFGMNDLLNL
jgi:4-hydroxy-tetrahydrodipicolinate reductase